MEKKKEGKLYRTCSKEKTQLTLITNIFDSIQDIITYRYGKRISCDQ